MSPHLVSQFKRYLMAGLVFVLCAALGDTIAYSKTINGGVSHDHGNAPMILRFKAVFDQDLDSKFLVDGDEVEAHLKQDIVVGDTVLAPAGASITGHVETLTTRKGKKRRSAGLLIQFERIDVSPKNHLYITGYPVPQKAIFANGGRFKQVVVGPDGEISKLNNLDMWQSSDFDVVLPESMVNRHRKNHIFIEAGDQLEIRAEYSPNDGAPRKSAAATTVE